MHELVRLPTAKHASTWTHVVGSKSRGVISQTNKDRQGHVTTKQLRVVCKACNETWMSQIEEAAKPVLTPLILGQAGLLDQQMQARVATWVTLKVMVAEQNQRQEAVFTEEERALFMREGAIPSGVSICIARCFSTLWRNAFLRCSGQLALSPTLPPTVFPTAEKKNVQTSAFGIGELFVYTMVSRAEGIDLNDLIQVRDHLIPIRPSASGVELPIRYIIPEGVANGIALALHALMNSEHVHHFDIPT
jgi:hypothetical protein